MRRTQSVPFLPGMSAVRNPIPGEKNFYYRKGTFQWNDGRVDKYKSNVCYYQDEIDSLVKSMMDPCWKLDKSKPALTHEERRQEKEDRHKDDISLRLKPAWMKHDRQVLRFQGYMQEPVTESATENSRLRYCTLLFYLEDGTTQIDEAKIENSGIAMQGALIKRHCIPRADNSGVLSIEDFKCGEEVEIYNKRFRIVSCDPFTRWYYEQIGLDVGVDELAPEDRFNENMRISKAHTLGEFGMPRNIVEGKRYNEKMIGGGNPNAKLEQFLRNDKKVLRFYCYWDDHSRYGTRMFSAMHFFLSDNTVEFTEIAERNSGKANFPSFYGRNKLPKDPKLTVAPGMLVSDAETYGPKDFDIGATVEVYGRKFFLYACDEFTRQFYKQFNGKDLVDISLAEPPAPKVEVKYPPHAGFGGEEDSLASVINLRPKVPKQDYVKLMTMDGKILRFSASCSSRMQEDAGRMFIVTFFMADDTIGVFETKNANSGFMEGLFCERAKKKNPATGEWFKPTEFFVGARVVINAMVFNLLRPDEYTLKFMESNPQIFPMSDVELIVNKIKDHLPATSHVHPDKLLRHLAERRVPFEDQEMITLVRHFGTVDSSTIDLDIIRACLRGEAPPRSAQETLLMSQNCA